MKLKEKKDMLSITFDSMNMDEERSEEILKELVNYNTELENKEEKVNMKERRIKTGEGSHEISPKNNKNNRWQYVLGSLCVLAAASFGIFMWRGSYIDDKGGKTAPGSNAYVEETTAGEVSADKKTDALEEADKNNAVFDIVTGDGQTISVKTDMNVSEQEELIYEFMAGDIKMKLKKDYNYNIYSRQTDNGLEMMAVGIRKEGNTYYYIYSKQLKQRDIIEETGKISDETVPVEQGELNGSSITPEFVEVIFIEGERYINSREQLLERLSSFYNTVNEFIDSSCIREPQEKCKQNGIEGELDGEFEYKILQDAEKSYITCGIKDPIDSRLEMYFRYIDGEIGQ